MHKFTVLELKKIRWLILLVFPMLLTACRVSNVEWELKISGNVSNPITYSFDELAKMEFVDLNDVLMERSRPDDISTITAIAADGYAIEISKDEMVNGIVALMQSGEWIVDEDPDAGPIRLVFPTMPANRWIFQVNEIVINQ